MKRFTTAIRAAADAENWYAALSMALSLPDVCGRLEQPSVGSKKRYVAWFQKWIEPKYTLRIGHPGTLHVFLCGEDCYALRCSYHHEGGGNIVEQGRARKALRDFHFTTPPRNGTVHMNQVGDTLQLQVDIFANDMATAVDAWSTAVACEADIQGRLAALLTVHDGSKGVRF